MEADVTRDFDQEAILLYKEVRFEFSRYINGEKGIVIPEFRDRWNETLKSFERYKELYPFSKGIRRIFFSGEKILKVSIDTQKRIIQILYRPASA